MNLLKRSKRRNKAVSCIAIITMLISLMPLSIVQASDQTTKITSTHSTTNALTQEYKEGDFKLVENGTAADIYVDTDDFKGVVRAAGDLKEDVNRVTSVTPLIKNSTAELSEFSVIIGTIGKSPIIDQLIAEGKLDVTDVEGKWEASVTQVVDQPLPNVKTGLVIAGSDQRGTIFGIYNLSEKIGVSPWYWWADVPTKHQDTLIIPKGVEKIGEPSVKYRGIFINDERNLEVWSQRNIEKDKNIGPETYKLVYELLLRMKANFLWPGMHPYTDYFNKHPENYELADEYGIVIGSTHTDMMLRNNMGEWDDWAAKHPRSDGARPEYDYTVDPENIYNYWDASVQEHSSYEIGWSLGMRGIHDTPFVTKNANTTEEKIEVLEKIFADQQEMLKNHVNTDLSKVFQMFTPYKEVLDLYNAGLEVPDNVTLIWPDDNYGYMRRLPNAEEQQRSGGNGLYYHFSYNHGRNNVNPNRSYLWIPTTPLTTIWEELKKSYDHNVRELWVVNVGDIKPLEIQTEFFMDMAWDVDQFNKDNIDDYLTNWMADSFSPEFSDKIANVFEKHLQYTLARRPYFLETGLFSDVHYGDEAQQHMVESQRLVEQAEAIYSELPEEQKDAFYELVLYPVKGAYYMYKKFYYASKNELYKKQGRGYSLNLTADAAVQAQSDEEKETKYYNTELADGKWNGMMSPYPDTYIAMAPKVPEVSRIPMTATKGLGVVAEGQTTGTEKPLKFSSYTKDNRFIDVFNTGFLPYEWRATASEDWIKLSESEGTMSAEERIWVSIDWTKVPSGESSGTVTINGANDSMVVKVFVSKPSKPSLSEIDGYLEANGYVSIDASHFTNKVDRNGSEWQVVPGLGRSGDAVINLPSTGPSITENITTTAPELQYKIYFSNTGTFPVEIQRMPTLDETGKVRLAVSIDDNEPVIVEGQNKASGGKWVQNVMEGTEKLTSELTISDPGYHTLKVWKVDPAIVVEKIIINTGGLGQSYFAQPESYHSAFNTDPAITPAEMPELPAPLVQVDSIMNKLISDAKIWSTSVGVGSDVGQYSEQLKVDLDGKISDAEEVMENTAASEEVILAAINALDKALKAFKASKKMSDKEFKYLAYEKFDSYPTGTVPLDWNVYIGDGDLSITEEPNSTNKSLKLFGGTGRDKVSAKVEFAPFKGILTLEQKVRVDTPQDFIGLPYIYDSEGKIAHSLRVMNGQMQVSNGSSWINLVAPERGKWYQIKLTINTMTNKYDLYLNGSLKVNDGNLRSQVNNISALDFYSDIGEATQAYLDDVKLYFDKNPFEESLENLIDTSSLILNGAVVGSGLGQYPTEEVLNKFESAIEVAKEALLSGADQDIKDALAALQIAQRKFLASRIMSDENFNYFVYDHFNNYKPKELPGGWITTNGNGEVKIKADGDTGNNFVEINKTASGSGKTSAQITFEPVSETAIVEAKIKVGEEQTVKLAPYIYDGTGDIAASIMYDSDGYIKARTGSSWTSVYRYQPNEWHTLKMELNLVTGKFNLYINDDEVLKDAILRTPVEAISKIEFYLDKSATTLSVDDVRVYKPKPDWPKWGNGPFVEKDGYVAIEAETALKYSEEANITPGSNHTWGEVSGLSYSAVKAFYDSGDYWTNTKDLNGNSPELAYKMDISTPGTYNVWMLTKAVDNASDSIHVGLDNQYKFSNTSLPKSHSFVWAKVGTLTINEAGVHDLNVWAREDGIVLDKIYLTMGADVPKDAGPIMRGDRTAIPIDLNHLDEFISYGEENNWIENSGIETSLLAKVKNIQNSEGNAKNTQNAIKALLNEVGALEGKKIDNNFARMIYNFVEKIK